MTSKKHWDYENCKDSKYGVHYSRYMISWYNEGGEFNEPVFKEWLKSLELDAEDIQNIYFLATNGKMELEKSARRFLMRSVEV